MIEEINNFNIFKDLEKFKQTLIHFDDECF